jgi:DNA-binding response OmpR family regulator
MLTAKNKRADVEAASSAGATGYIHKPFEGTQLTELVAELRAERDRTPKA